MQRARREGAAEPEPGQVADYKRVLADVLAARPSGTRQRLAHALGKNRSFISHIANPDYATPIPATHIETIFEVCHFSSEARRGFLEAYARAHPRRPVLVRGGHRQRVLTIQVPDFGNDRKNARFAALLADFARSLAGLIEEEPPE